MNFRDSNLTVLLATMLVFAVACGGDEKDPNDPNRDDDKDGFTVGEGDCDDLNKSVFPGAADPCDGVDQNCDGTADEVYDQDKDGWTTCAGDCRDNDDTSYPMGVEIVDGFDNDCDGIADNHTEQSDDDGDGYSEDQGDCDDDENGNGALIGPDAVEVNKNSDDEPEGVDNDCDGEVDEGPDPCITDGVEPGTPTAHAQAMDVCQGLLEARWSEDLGIDVRSRAIVSNFGGTYVPAMGDTMVSMASGLAGDSSAPDFVDRESGTDFDMDVPHPDPQGAMGCSSNDPDSVNDYTEIELVLQVPSNAQALSFDFNFMSVEFPEFVCSSFDDTFLAILESAAFNGNVSFDAMGNRVSVNVGFFDVCETSVDPAVCTGGDELKGTGYDVGPGYDGGGTGWLTTTAPVVPNEKVRLKFVIFDEGDHILDSGVLIDNFRWEVEPVDGPVTVDRELPMSTLEDAPTGEELD